MTPTITAIGSILGAADIGAPFPILTMDAQLGAYGTPKSLRKKLPPSPHGTVALPSPPSPTTAQSMNLVTAIVEVVMAISTVLQIMAALGGLAVGFMFGAALVNRLHDSRANGPDTEPQYETGDELE